MVIVLSLFFATPAGAEPLSDEPGIVVAPPVRGPQIGGPETPVALPVRRPPAAERCASIGIDVTCTSGPRIPSDEERLEESLELHEPAYRRAVILRKVGLAALGGGLGAGTLGGILIATINGNGKLGPALLQGFLGIVLCSAGAGATLAGSVLALVGHSRAVSIRDNRERTRSQLPAVDVAASARGGGVRLTWQF
jgi:hypothetical protein